MAIGTLLFFGGLGVEKVIVQYDGVLVGILMLILVALWKGRVKFPKGFLLYILFLLLLGANLIWSKDTKATFEYLVLFTGGGFFWLTFYNLKREFAPYLDKLIVILGVVFAGLFIVNHYFGAQQVRPWSLYLPYTAYFNHNNIGDFWAVVLTVVGYQIIKHKRRWYWLLVALGAYLLFMSQSRAAYVALAAGIIYLSKGKGWAAKYKKILALFIFLAAGLFILVGASKLTLLSRPYFVQAIAGFVHNPFGVGVGNFGIISSDPENHIWGLSHFSTIAHNIVLEIISGMGILGIVFVAWLFRIAENLWEEKSPKALVYRAIFFALLTNFLFHSTYFIPAMLWLWFMSLGLSQNRVRRQ